MTGLFYSLIWWRGYGATSSRLGWLTGLRRELTGRFEKLGKTRYRIRNRQRQVALLDRLDEIAHDVAHFRARNQGIVMIGGHQYYRHGPPPANLRGRIDAVQFRHFDVGDHQVRLCGAALFY